MTTEHATTDPTLYELLRVQAERAPLAVALLSDAGFSTDFDSLVRLIPDTVSSLQSLGITHRDRIAVILPQGPVMALTCLAVTCGAICVPLNPESTGEELDYLLRRLGIKLLISSIDFCMTAQRSAANLGVPVVLAQPGAKRGIELTLSSKELEASAAPTYSGPEDIALLLLTSGTSAKPKVVPLSHRNLVASALNLVHTLKLDHNDRCLSMMPQFHIGALVDLLLAPLVSGGSVVIARDMSNKTFASLMQSHAPSWYQGVPTMLQSVASTAAAISCSSLRLVRSVSAPLPIALQETIESAFEAPVIEIYGMTETSGQICSNPLPPAVRKPGSVGVAAGPEVAIIDDLGNPARPGSQGEVAVRGSNVMTGYEAGDDEDSLQHSFIGGWLRTGDQGYFDSDGYLFLTGRIKDIINRGGEKISPREIDELLASHPAIREAAAFALDHDSLGEEVAVAVVIEDTQTLSEQEIKDYLAPKLAQFKLPRRIFRLHQLPRGPGGKLKRTTLSEQYSDKLQSAPQHTHTPPNTPLGRTIAGAWARALEIEQVGLHDDFFDLGGHSLGAAMLIEELEQQLGISIDAAALYESPTIAEFETWLNEHGVDSEQEPAFRESGLPQQVYRELAQNTAGWRGRRLDTDALIVGRNTLGTKQPLFMCWNGALDALTAYFGVDQPVYCMRDGWGLPSKSEDNTALIATHYASEIKQIQSSGPWCVGGFCEGGKIAFEVARILSAEDPAAVSCLMLIEQFVPKNYNGRVALLFCESGRMSAYHHYQTPDIGWKKYYRGETTLSVGPWDHQELVAGRALQPLLQEISAVLAQTPGAHQQALTEPRHELQLIEDNYQCQIITRIPRVMSAARNYSLKIELTNSSTLAWKPWQLSGLAVGARWRRSGRRHRYPGPLAGIARLATELQPGESIELDLWLQSPEKPGLWELHIDAVEEGVTWFSSHSGFDLQQQVFINASPVAWLSAIGSRLSSSEN